MDAIALLKADHDKVKQLLTRLEDTTERAVKTRAELFATIKGELTVHEIIEEEIFYPELKSHPKAKDIVLEGFEEHHVVDLLMGELVLVEDGAGGLEHLALLLLDVVLDVLLHHNRLRSPRLVVDGQRLEVGGRAR